MAGAARKSWAFVKLAWLGAKLSGKAWTPLGDYHKTRGHASEVSNARWLYCSLLDCCLLSSRCRARPQLRAMPELELLAMQCSPVGDDQHGAVLCLHG